MPILTMTILAILFTIDTILSLLGGHAMEDKRIRKSKEALGQALLALLQETPLDHIRITELCRRAGVSRITFYAHYEDKYALVDEMVQALLRAAQASFVTLQRRNNLAGDPVLSYCNLLDCFLDLYDSHEDFFRHMSIKRNPYLYHAFYDQLLEYVARQIDAESRSLPPKYSSHGITDFLCHGMWGYISRRFRERTPMAQIRAEARDLLRGLMSSGALMKRSWPAGPG